MASSQKKKTSSTKNRSKAGAKSGATSGKKPANARQPERTRQDVFADGVMFLIVLCVMIFVMFCNIGLCGLAGKYVSGFLFGLFGAIQYVIPIAVCVAVALAVLYNYSGFIIRKISMSGVVLLLLCAVAHMCVHIEWGFEQIGQSYLYSSENHAAGGFFGALITSIFYPLLSKSGTWLLMIVALLILLLLIAGSSVVDVAKSIAAWYDMDEEELVAREEYRNRRRERSEARQQERRQVRKQRFEEAARREEEELSQVRARQLNRRERLEQGGFIGMDGHSIRLTDGDGGEEEVLSDKGLAKQEESTSQSALSAAQKSAERTANDTVQNGQAKSSDNASSSANTVSIAPGGELRITGLVGEDEDTQYIKPYNDFSIAGNEPVRDANAFANTANTVKVTETTAEFVREDVESQNSVVRDERGAVDAEPAKTSKRRTRATAQEAAEQAVQTAQEIAQQGDNLAGERYERPLLTLLSRGARAKGNSKAQLQATAKKLEDTLDSFGVHVTVTDVSCGPAVTRYEMMPEQGTRVSKITGLTDDIKLNLAVADIRMEAPIPGKAAIGIEVPNKEAAAVAFRDLLEDSDFMQQESDLAFAVGKDIAGKVVISDIAKMPHVLIAGATGSGKSVCINTLIMSLLYKAHPDDVKLIMIDPKVVELSVYNGIPHLLIPVVTDPKKASGALNWAVAEMEARYKKFAEYNVRNLEGYNKKVDSLTAKGENPDGEIKRMPKIVIIVDELADLMMVAHGEVEDAIVRLSQLARAAGIHLVIATQRPSVDVITGLIKANVPSRIAFAVSSGVDSRTILDMNGAEKLLGKGDMLFAPSGYPKPVRVQGAFVSDKEVSKVVEFLKAQDLNIKYNDNITREINCGPQSVRDANKGQERDEYFVDAGKFIIEKEKASIGMLQRMYKIGFNRAARIMDQLSEAGVVGPEVGTKPRDILMSMEEFENFLEQGL